MATILALTSLELPEEQEKKLKLEEYTLNSHRSYRQG